MTTWFEELTHWKRPWRWEGLKAGGEGDDSGWGSMVSPTQGTWVWVSSRSWWWTGKPSVLQSMGSQRAGHDWVMELKECECMQFYSLVHNASYYRNCSFISSLFFSIYLRTIEGSNDLANSFNSKVACKYRMMIIDFWSCCYLITVWETILQCEHLHFSSIFLTFPVILFHWKLSCLHLYLQIVCNCKYLE